MVSYRNNTWSRHTNPARRAHRRKHTASGKRFPTRAPRSALLSGSERSQRGDLRSRCVQDEDCSLVRKLGAPSCRDKLASWRERERERETKECRHAARASLHRACAARVDGAGKRVRASTRLWLGDLCLPHTHTPIHAPLMHREIIRLRRSTEAPDTALLPHARQTRACARRRRRGLFLGQSTLF